MLQERKEDIICGLLIVGIPCPSTTLSMIGLKVVSVKLILNAAVWQG